MRTLLKQTLRFFLPWACAGCRGALSCLDDNGFCGRCWLRIPRIDGLVCRYCGLPLRNGGESCFSCRKGPSTLLIRAAVEYKGPVPPAVHRFKYSGRKTLDASFGLLLQSAISRYPELQPVEALIPVPLHPQNQRIRGFNQAEALAEKLAHFEGIPLLTGILKRRRPTTPQYRLSKPDRRENLRGAFAVDVLPPSPVTPEIRYAGSRLTTCRDDVNNKHLLLIDDICTTGATLQECAKVLRRAGAASVKALVLARD